MKQFFMMVYSLMLALSLTACGFVGSNQRIEISPSSTASAEMERGGQEVLSVISSSDEAESGEQTENDRKIQITTDKGKEIVFKLNTSQAANAFYNQLPISIWIEDYAESEKIFYPPEKLDTNNTPAAQGPIGTLAYYAPWGNVAIFYRECKGASGLYELGEAISGTEWIDTLSGEIEMKAAESPSFSSASVKPENTSSQQAQPLSVEKPASQDTVSKASSEENTIMKMNVQIGTATFSATLEENAAAASFIQLIKKAPVVVQMSDYSGFEKVGSLGTRLPASNIQTTTQSGDIVLYNSDQIVMFYGSNSWSYTILGRIDDLSGWEEALGGGDITATFSLQ